jgi:hypothetical protein
MSAISGYVFSVHMCHIKIPSDFCFPIPYPFCTKEITLLQSLPTMLSIKWLLWLTMSQLVHFMWWNLWAISYSYTPGWPSWNSADCCNVYLSGTNKMYHLCIFIVIFSPTCFGQQICHHRCDISVKRLQSDQMCQITPQCGNSYDCWLELSVG